MPTPVLNQVPYIDQNTCKSLLHKAQSFKHLIQLSKKPTKVVFFLRDHEHSESLIRYLEDTGDTFISVDVTDDQVLFRELLHSEHIIQPGRPITFPVIVENKRRVEYTSHKLHYRFKHKSTFQFENGRWYYRVFRFDA